MPWTLAQQTTETIEWLTLAREFGAIAVLAFMVFAWIRGLFYGRKAVEKLEESWNARLADMTAERNTWRDLAINGTDIAGRAIRVAEQNE